MKKKAVMILFYILIMCAMFFFTLFSPYKYEWDDTIKQIDEDKLDFLRIIWLLMSVVTGAMLLYQNKWGYQIQNHLKSERIFYIFRGIVFAYCLFMLIHMLILR